MIVSVAVPSAARTVTGRAATKQAGRGTGPTGRRLGPLRRTPSQPAGLGSLHTGSQQRTQTRKARDKDREPSRPV